MVTRALVDCPICTNVAYRNSNGRISCSHCQLSIGEFNDDTLELDVEASLYNQEYIDDQLCLEPDCRDIPSLFTI